MSNSWILIETFGDAEPTVIGVGSSPKSFVPPRKVLRSSTSREEAVAAVAEALSTGTVVDRPCKDRYRRILAEPLHTFAGRTHGAWVWLGQRDETPPRRDAAGAWQFNLTKSTASGSNDLLDLYCVPQDERETQRALAGAFTRLVTNRDESEAMAKIVQSAPGTTHQAVWTVRRDDGELRAAHFSCRMIAEDGISGTEVILRGITQDIGPAGEINIAPPPTILEHRVLEASTKEGEYRALVNLRNLSLLRWYNSEPAPSICWENLPDEPVPAIHPDDIPIAKQMSNALARERTNGVLRFRTLDGDWKPMTIDAVLVSLDQHTTAALVTLTELCEE
ncbi:hypothetical protein CH306_17690 [Rhodococcus sp. 15-725-2-2b]|uniref:GAF domain-containing protein n=1 Tax=Nocardiaceae TaxID=85025 RepID=UPI00056BA7FB|nr:MULTISPECIES: GAF domain-containing protein [Rhodococcus]OZC61988.1 hypothetical protein CH276_15365 [Rhodococcus sp. 06-470-2]OZC64514.1 hypothetical protein CH277_17595 [Rhodococcus sp. 06-469-3-2]OZC88050.1 hypothetical protein CH282_07815 [Rhodococcus sp. 06-418-1B]OZD51147.1 hypothetical protein CH264_02230 [Rhodococcus sp. 06-1477-1A]OZE32155.1 hypothetical protein CH278_15110 [Rhodococcus sp. 05-2254-5]